MYELLLWIIIIFLIIMHIYHLFVLHSMNKELDMSYRFIEDLTNELQKKEINNGNL